MKNIRLLRNEFLPIGKLKIEINDKFFLCGDSNQKN